MATHCSRGEQFEHGPASRRSSKLEFGTPRQCQLHAAEGPLLDLLIDYDLLAPRILDGALGDVLARAGHPLPRPEEAEQQDIDD